VNHDSLRFDGSVRRGNSKQFAGVHAFPRDVTDDEVAFRHLQSDLVPSRRRQTEHLSRRFHPVTIERHTWKRRRVRDEILRDELVEDAPVAVGVRIDGFDVSANQRLVLG
jgi:hypothetical protein